MRIRTTLCLLTLLSSCEDPIVWRFTMVNNGLDNAHMFLSAVESGAGSNKVEQGAIRTIEYDFGTTDTTPEVVTIEAYRGGTFLAAVICPGAPAEDHGWTVTFTEQDGPGLTCVSD